MSAVYNLVKGAYRIGYNRFGVPDKLGALDYLRAAVMLNVSWAQAEEDIRVYLSSIDMEQPIIEAEVLRAKTFLKPWLT